ncbi:MAG: hypothetical protein J6N77_02080 [Lachnospiraceae bacterium]|nr:hypothetical protein [Lachnospiraceae bacterium]
MSRPNPSYEGSRRQRFMQWLKGDYDPSEGKLETTEPDTSLFTDSEYHEIHLYLRNEYADNEEYFRRGVRKHLTRIQKLYRLMAVITAIFMTVLLLWAVSYEPSYGDPNAPENNEVATRYIEKGLSETGAINIVAGMILDYRAFDTFGESCVLFVALCCVLILLRVDADEEAGSHAREAMFDRHFEPKNDIILQRMCRVLVPAIVIFGIYVVLNGHLSPGGGFSGGAIIGTGLILYLTAFGFANTERFMTEKVARLLSVAALTFYCFAKSYSFYTGANHLPSVISTGTPGAILSAGLIVYLNICVGIVVACTMYSFYVLFRKGGY